MVAGDPGEIWVRGANVFVGYWDDPEATARVLVDGWLRTGDVAVADDDGYLSLVDRKKDLVIVSGFNVFPAEVEEVLLEHPGIADAAVIGVPSPRTGEAVAAWVVAEPGVTLTVEGVREHAARQLARYKVPATVEIVAELPAQRRRASCSAASYDTWASRLGARPTLTGLLLARAGVRDATRKPA